MHSLCTTILVSTSTINTTHQLTATLSILSNVLVIAAVTTAAAAAATAAAAAAVTP